MRSEDAYSNEIRCSQKDSDSYLLVATSDRGCPSIRGVCLCIRGVCPRNQRGVSLSAPKIKDHEDNQQDKP
jgi:hypothetical protein